MSFNINDNNAPLITRANYEEYFLLYVDNELTVEERKAVEDFLALHPDLQAEMDVLLSTKLPFSEEIGLEDKSFLLADQMKLSTIDESLLLYIDNELSREDKEKVEKKIVADKEFGLQHQVLLKTKLDPTEQIVYPYKKELYKHTERRIAPYWLRIAAAVLVVLGIGAAWMLTGKPETNNTLVNVSPTKNNTEEIKEQALPVPQTTDVAIAQQEMQTTKEENEKEVAPVVAKVEKNSLGRSIAKQHSKEKPEDVIPEVRSNNLPLPVVDEPTEPLITVTEPKVAPQQSLNNNPVTIVSNNPYNNQQASPTTAVNMEDVAKVDKKASLKGLLRKATRFIERRTNISATNENDELLIGAVALKL